MQHLLWKLLCHLKNALLVRKKSVIFPIKSGCVLLLKVLYKEGYISGYRILPGNKFKMEIFLKYDNGKPAISKVFFVSTPGKRSYVSLVSLWKLSTSLQTLILSTPKGILSDKESRKYRVGGELLCILQ